LVLSRVLRYCWFKLALLGFFLLSSDLVGGMYPSLSELDQGDFSLVVVLITH